MTDVYWFNVVSILVLDVQYCVEGITEGAVLYVTCIPVVGYYGYGSNVAEFNTGNIEVGTYGYRWFVGDAVGLY